MMCASIVDPEFHDSLAAYLLAWADDELILGHRDSEWTGFAPMLEEDLAFSSIAQDEIGHASLIYGLLCTLFGGDPDHVALQRPAASYRHGALVERPNGDWAHTIARHYLYDLADAVRVEALCGSTYAPLAGIARKMSREEQYHRLHGEMWWDRLANGSAESRERLIAAVHEVAPLALDILGPTEDAGNLHEVGLLPGSLAGRSAAWRELTRPILVGLDPTLACLIDREPTSRDARPVGPTFSEVYVEMTMVSASGLGERW